MSATTGPSGWPLDPPASSSEAWSTILYALADAATAVGRYSHLARTVAPADEQELQALAQQASNRIARLAAAVLIELGQRIDRETILAEAAAFLQEVDHEDDGLQHASDALGSLLQAKLMCLEERVELPHAERDQAAVKILSPPRHRPTHATLEGHTHGVNAVAFSPDDSQLASASDDGTVRLWGADGPATISQLRLGAPLPAIAWGPCGITVAAHTQLVQLAIIHRPASIPCPDS